MENARIRILALPAVAALALLAPSAHATGVEAGTIISNTATATYTSGATSGSISSNTVTVRVDELLDVAVAGTASSPVLVGATTAVLPFTITNTGNGPEAFNLTVAPTVSGNQFDAAVQSIVIDTNNNGTYDPGTDTVLTSGAPTPSIGSDESLGIFVLVTLPSGATDGQTSQLRVTAAAVTGTGAPGTSFAGQGEGGGDAVVGTSGGDDDGLDAMIASAATVALAKSATILDPFGGTKPVPGAVVTYSIVATVSGSGTASGLRVLDSYPAGTTYQAATMTLEGSALTDAADTDAGLANGTGIDVNLGDVAGGSTRTVTFKVRIN